MGRGHRSQPIETWAGTDCGLTGGCRKQARVCFAVSLTQQRPVSWLGLCYQNLIVLLFQICAESWVSVEHYCYILDFQRQFLLY